MAKANLGRICPNCYEINQHAGAACVGVLPGGALCGHDISAVATELVPHEAVQLTDLERRNFANLAVTRLFQRNAGNGEGPVLVKSRVEEVSTAARDTIADQTAATTLAWLRNPPDGLSHPVVDLSGGQVDELRTVIGEQVAAGNAAAAIAVDQRLAPRFDALRQSVRTIQPASGWSKVAAVLAGLAALFAFLNWMGSSCDSVAGGGPPTTPTVVTPPPVPGGVKVVTDPQTQALLRQDCITRCEQKTLHEHPEADPAAVHRACMTHSSCGGGGLQIDGFFPKIQASCARLLPLCSQRCEDGDTVCIEITKVVETLGCNATEKQTQGSSATPTAAATLVEHVLPTTPATDAGGH